MEEGFAHLEAFFRDHGHCRVAQSYMTADGYKLGQWIAVQRTTMSKGRLSKAREARLNAIGLAWDARGDNWEEGFAQLEAFHRRHGHCRVTRSYKTADGYKLAQWVQTQRTFKPKSHKIAESV
jgi:hypothetical protein